MNNFMCTSSQIPLWQVIVTIAAVAVLLFSGVEKIEIIAMQITELMVTVPAIKGSVAISIFICQYFRSQEFRAHWLANVAVKIPRSLALSAFFSNSLAAGCSVYLALHWGYTAQYVGRFSESDVHFWGSKLTG